MEEFQSLMSKVSEEVSMPSTKEADKEVDFCMEELCVSPMQKSMDYSNLFNTNEVFPSRDELLNWARAIGREIGFIIVIVRSDIGGPRRKTMLVLGCERSGKYKQHKNELTRKVTRTKKCQCPFRLRGRPLANGEGWKLNVVCGFHNHEIAESLDGHPYASRLSVEEKSMHDDMTKNMVKPISILLSLKDHNDHNVTTIYNAHKKFRREERGPKTEMQHLMKLMQRDKYVYWHRKVEMSDVVRDILWAHPDAIKLLNSFHIVLIVDNTYKTNKYGLPLLEIVGVTSTEMTFSVAFAYLESKKGDNFIWALEKLRGLILREECLPQVIVTDRDIALMNAVQTVFPTCTNLLCQFHIMKNVTAMCKMVVYPKEEWDSVMDAWVSVMDSPSETEYKERLNKFEEFCSRFPFFIDYAKNTWLIPHKEKFVAAWTDRVMHLGNTTTNKVESSHARLKKLLQDSSGNLCSCWDAMNNMMTLQNTEIKASFERSSIVVEHRFNKAFYEKLRGFVSRSALCHMALEYDRVNLVGIDSSICGCTLRKTHGLPCACELARYSNLSSFVPLHSVHTHWKTLNFANQDMNEAWSELSLQNELDALLKRFKELDIPGKIALKTKLRELVFLNTTCPPPENVKTIGSVKHRLTKRDPSYFEYVDALLSFKDSTSSHPSSHKSMP